MSYFGEISTTIHGSFAVSNGDLNMESPILSWVVVVPSNKSHLWFGVC